MKSLILVVGSYNQDLIWNTRTFPLPGQTRVGRFTTLPGGKGSNQAVAVARLGVPTAFCGAVGDDSFGRALPEFYQSEDIEPHLVFKQDAPTGNAAIWVNGEGENEIIISAGANAELMPADIPMSVLGKSHMLLAQNETKMETMLWAFEQARSHSVTTVLNPAPMREDFAFSILRYTDILVPNQSEFVELLSRLGESPTPTFCSADVAELPQSELHALCRKLDVPTVIVTLGSRGCFVDTADSYELVPARKGVEAVDTTGAGDAFIGGLCAHLATENAGAVAAATYASAVAALCVQCPGASPSMPTKAEVARFLKGSSRS